MSNRHERTDILESTANKFLRRLLSLCSVVLIAIGVLFLTGAVVARDVSALIPAGLGIASGFYLKRHLARVKAIGRESIVLASNNMEVELHKSEIRYVFKFVRYPVTKRLGLFIALSSSKGRRSSYIVVNEPDHDLIPIFVAWNIRLLNHEPT